MYHYVILGTGRQGTAAGYDLARFGDASIVTMADMDEAAALRAAQRINDLIGRPVARGVQMDVTDLTSLEALLTDADCALSAVPYFFNLDITKVAIKTRTHFCDMGGNTDVVFAQLALDDSARQAGISIVPDCGMGPGLINTMAAYVIAQFDKPEEIFIYDGGMPQKPTPPWNYNLLFHINGLTNEYFGRTAFLRNGEITWVDGMTENESVSIPALGQLEAFITTGGTSTAPWTWQGTLKTYQNKTLRYPGHFNWFEGFKHLGLFDLDPVQVGNQTIIPREVFHALLAPRITVENPKDVCVIHIVGKGQRAGRHAEIIVDLADYYDEETGFLAMERLTGWHCAIMMGFQARGAVRPGSLAMETAVRPADFMAELPKRGLNYTIEMPG